MGACIPSALERAAANNHADVAWHLPEWPLTHAAVFQTALAARPFQPQEIVAMSFCLHLPQGLSGSYLQDYCINFPCSQPSASLSRKERACTGVLLPLGWGLVIGRDATSANLEIECLSANAATSPVVIFKAVRRISRGEPLCTRPLCHTTKVCATAAMDATVSAMILKPIFQTALESIDDSFVVDKPPYALSDSPTYLRMSSEGSVEIRSSALHGYGVFALRDMRVGDVIETAPLLPINWHEFRGTVLEEYVYRSDFLTTDKEETPVAVIPLGNGCFYNHGSSSSSRNACVRAHSGQPFIQSWVAEEFIAQGEEVLVDYGDGYWQVDWRPDPISSVLSGSSKTSDEDVVSSNISSWCCTLARDDSVAPR